MTQPRTWAKAAATIGIATAVLAAAVASTAAASAGTDHHQPENIPATLTNSQAGGRVALVQIIDSWARSIDSQDSNAAAAMFTNRGAVRLLYSDTKTTPFTLKPTGYSPSSTATGGTPGGGCTAVGRRALTDYFSARYGDANYQWPSSAHRTYIFDTTVHFQNHRSASSRSYALTYSGNSQSGQLIDSGQIWNTYEYSPGVGWRITEMRLVEDSPQPTSPCQR